MTRKTQTPIWLTALNWLVEKDRRYREAQTLKTMPYERLDDMGLTRKEADRAFLAKPFDRPADRAPMPLALRT